MTDQYLFDTSSLLYILKTRSSQKLDRQDCFIIYLTFYEFGNAALNLATKRGEDLPEEDTRLIIQAFEGILELARLQNLETASMSEIFGLANKEKITFYDASYLYCTKREKCQLVTEDEKLTTAAKNNLIDVFDASKWIKAR